MKKKNNFFWKEARGMKPLYLQRSKDKDCTDFSETVQARRVG